MNKAKWVQLIIVSFVSILTYSCTSDEECQSTVVEITDLEDFGCSNTAFTMSVLTSNEFELIRNAEDFTRLIDLQCSPQINWLEYDMIAGMTGLPKGLASIEKQLVTNCTDHQLTLTFDIILNLTQVAPQISYHALIPKIKDDQDIVVTINVKE